MKISKYAKKVFSTFLTLTVLGLNGLFAQGNYEQSLNKYLADYYNQSNNCKIYFVTDKTLYAHGEKIWVSAFYLDRNTHIPKRGEQQIRLELIDPSGVVLLTKTMKLQDGRGESCIPLPDINSFGKFRLQASLPNSSIILFSKDLTVSKNAIPAFLVDVSFKDTYYSGGDDLQVVFVATDFFKQPLKGASYQASVNVGDQVIYADGGRLNKNGTSIVSVKLPNPLPDKEVVFNLSILQKGLMESCAVEIPTKSDNVFVDFYPEGGQLVHGLKNFMHVKARDQHGDPFLFSGKVVGDNGDVITHVKSDDNGAAFLPLLPNFNRHFKLIIDEPYTVFKEFDYPEVKPVGVNFGVRKIEGDSVFLRVRRSQGETASLLLFNIHQGAAYLLEEINVEGLSNFTLSKNRLKPGVNQLVLFDKNLSPLAEQLIFIAPKKVATSIISADNVKHSPREEVNLTVNPKDKSNFLFRAVDEFRAGSDAANDNIYSSLYLNSELEENLFIPAQDFRFPDVLEKKVNEQLVYEKSANSWSDIFHSNDNSINFLQANAGGKFELSKSQFTYFGKNEGYIYFRNYDYQNYYLASNPILFDELQDNIKKEEDKPYYKKMLESGQSLRDVIYGMKQYQVIGNKIVFTGSMNSMSSQEGALIVLDNLKLGDDIGLLDNINTVDVDKIFISTKPIDYAMYTSMNSVGIIEITTKSGKLENSSETDDSEEFEVVNHSENEKKWNQQKDLRTTVHWIPQLTTYSNSNTIRYYLSDIRSNFVNVVEGIDKNGIPFHDEEIISTSSYQEDSQ